MDGLRVDELDNGVGEVLVGFDFLREVLGLDCLRVVDVHGQVIAFGPLLGDTAELAGLGVAGDLDSRAHQDGLPVIKFALVLLRQFWQLVSHQIISQFIQAGSTAYDLTTQSQPQNDSHNPKSPIPHPPTLKFNLQL